MEIHITHISHCEYDRFLCLFVILIGCKELSQDEKKNVVDYFTISNFSTKKIKIDRLIDMDSLKINGNKMSMVGNFFTHQDSLYFADCLQASILVYDKDGHYVRSIYRKGRGPMELNGLDVMTALPSGDFVIMDEQWGITVCVPLGIKCINLTVRMDKCKPLEEQRYILIWVSMKWNMLKMTICAYG
ncbi:MAG: 6-bladed beta-propeller [Butyricimonas faecihominis]